MRTFTLQEAQTLLPLVESLLKRAQTAATVAGTLELQLQQIAHTIYLSGGMLIDVAAVTRLKTAHEKAVIQARDALAEIDAIGVQIKDLEKARLPLRARRHHRPAVLAAGRADDHPLALTGGRL